MTAQYPVETQSDIECSSYVFIIKSELGIKIYINAAFCFWGHFLWLLGFFFNPNSC